MYACLSDTTILFISRKKGDFLKNLNDFLYAEQRIKNKKSDKTYIKPTKENISVYLLIVAILFYCIRFVFNLEAVNIHAFNGVSALIVISLIQILGFIMAFRINNPIACIVLAILHATSFILT